MPAPGPNRRARCSPRRAHRPRSRRRPARHQRRSGSRQGFARARATGRRGPGRADGDPSTEGSCPSARRLRHGPCSRCAVAGGRWHSAAGQHGGIADDSAPAIVNTVIASGADHIGEHDTRRSPAKCQRSRCAGGAALRLSGSEVECYTPSDAPTRPFDGVREGPEPTMIDHSRSPTVSVARNSTVSRHPATRASSPVTRPPEKRATIPRTAFPSSMPAVRPTRARERSFSHRPSRMIPASIDALAASLRTSQSTTPVPRWWALPRLGSCDHATVSIHGVRRSIARRSCNHATRSA